MESSTAKTQSDCARLMRIRQNRERHQEQPHAGASGEGREPSVHQLHGEIMIAAILGDMLDLLDYFLIGYVLAFIVHDSNVTYGQSAMVLLATGVGAVPGAFLWVLAR